MHALPFVRTRRSSAITASPPSLNFLESFLSALNCPQNSRYASVADLVDLRLEDAPVRSGRMSGFSGPPGIPDSDALLEECEMFCVGHLFTAPCSTDQPPPPWLGALSASRSVLVKARRTPARQQVGRSASHPRQLPESALRQHPRSLEADDDRRRIRRYGASGAQPRDADRL